jgi:siroheme synthase
VVVAELGTLVEAAVDLPGPALVVVGEVVRLRERIPGTSPLATAAALGPREG